MTAAPGYWMHETGGELQPAIWALIEGEHLSDQQIALIRAYLKQWIDAPGWHPGPGIEALRASVEGLDSVDKLDRWIDEAIRQGIDPL
jgi:hypothetical protein